MAKPNSIDLTSGVVIPILYEDRSALAIDKPEGWLLAPDSWDNTGRNLQLALNSAINGGEFWARSRNLKYLRFVHRLDAGTSGTLLLAKSPGALRTYSELFETRQVKKAYLAVVHGLPKQPQWICRLKLAPHPDAVGRVIVDARGGKDAETHFRVVQAGKTTALVEARPTTGRTHQIRVHLAETGHAVLGDTLYGPKNVQPHEGRRRLALRAVELTYPDPFLKRTVHITAPSAAFIREFGFEGEG